MKTKLSQKQQIFLLKTALEIMVGHAKETHPHFESPRGQSDIAFAVEVLSKIDRGYQKGITPEAI